MTFFFEVQVAECSRAALKPRSAVLSGAHQHFLCKTSLHSYGSLLRSCKVSHVQPSLKSGLSALFTQSMQQQSPEEGWPHTPAMAERVISAPPHTTLHAHSQSAPWAPYQEMLSDSIRHQFDQTPHQTSVDTDGCESHPVVSNSLQPPGPHSPWNSPGHKTGVGSLLQGTFPTQGSNPGLPHCMRILYQVSHK